MASNFPISRILLLLYCGSSLVVTDKIDAPVFRPSPHLLLGDVVLALTLSLQLFHFDLLPCLILHTSCVVPFTLPDGDCSLATLRPWTLSSQSRLVSELMYFTDAEPVFLRVDL